MGNTSSTENLQNVQNVHLKNLRVYISELREDFNYVKVYYVSRLGTIEYPKYCILEKTLNYDTAYKTLEYHFINQMPISLYVHPTTGQIYRISKIDERSGSTTLRLKDSSIDVIRIDGLDEDGNLFVNKSNTVNTFKGDLIES